VRAEPASWSRRAEGAFALAAPALAVAVFLLSWLALHHGFYARDQLIDTPTYQRYGDLMVGGAVPYRDFRPEYPPAALPVFAAPSLAAADAYRGHFESLMAAFGTVLVVLVSVALASLEASRRRLAAALTFVGLFPLALGSVVLTRYDLWPAALTAGVLAALLAGRDRVAAGLLGLVIAAKLYAAVLVPLVAVWLWRRRRRREALAAAAVLAGVLGAAFVPFAILAPDGLGASLERQLGRPLQIESLGAALLAAADGLGLGDVVVESSHGSQNVSGAAGAAVGAVQTALQGVALLAVWVAFARGPAERERLLRYSAAAVVAFVALAKVLSPQFLLWLVPLVPLVRGRRGLAASGLLGLALVLTQLWFPSRYWDYALRLDGELTVLVVARGLVLLALLAVLLAPDRRQEERL
jgi:hypothetical protein